MREVYNPKVSIIIPIYNTEQYLQYCLDSVLGQELKEIEIICVDDGSTDQSARIIDEYAQKDKRIRPIHKVNGGYGQAVNVGIDCSYGEYIGIVEPDDYIKTNMYSTLYKLASDNKLDFISSNHVRFVGVGEECICEEYKIINNHDLYNKVICSEHKKELFRGNFINPAGLFCRSFINQFDIRHNESPGASFQDLGFCFQVLAYANRAMLHDQCFYYYRQDNPNSSIANREKINCVIEEYNFIYQRVIKRNEQRQELLASYQRRRFGSFLYTFERVDRKYKLEFLKLISEEFRISRKKGELLVDMFPPAWVKKLEMITEEPEKYFIEYDTWSQRINFVIGQYSRVIIYGAGVMGKKVFDLMRYEDKEKILGFAVTSNENNIKMYKGTKVKKIDYYVGLKEDVLVLICVRKKFLEQIEEKLLEMKFKNYIYFELKLDENLY